MKRNLSRWVGVAMGVLALVVIVWTLAGAVDAGDGRLSPPEWPTQTPPPPDSTVEPLPTPTTAGYPGLEPTAEPYPVPYPMAGPGAYLPFVETYP